MLKKNTKLLTGSVIGRYMICGKPNCACRTDEAKRHGPYLNWTRKVNGRTKGKVLTQKQADKVRAYIKNTRELEDEINRVREETEEELFKE